MVREGRGEVPPPSALRAKIVVHGRTSTAQDIPVRKVGQEIPRTYAGEKVARTPGFDFYVSEHFALKTNQSEERARHLLEISELAHPHWVALVGAEPPDPELRMLITYADNVENLRKAMVSDLGMGPAGGFGGGFTAHANRSAYNYPSGTLQYHQRALVLHENLHMLTMICFGTGGTEGPTYAGEQHVYDPALRRLTVACFDKAPIHNYTDGGLDELRRQFVPIVDVARKYWRGGNAVGAVYQQFLWTDPDRLMKWRVWRDEFYLGRVDDATLVERLTSIYGPLDKFNDDWARWIRARRASFHHVDWGWEQDGAAIWAYGFPWNQKFWSQMNLNFPPGEKCEADALRLDYPAPAQPPIVGTVRRGVEEPAVGYTIEKLDGRAWGGLGLGVDERTMCQVVILGNRTLVVDGTSIGMSRHEFPLDDALQAAARAHGNRYGVTITLRHERLEIVVRAGNNDSLEEQTCDVAINGAQRQRLLERPLALIGKDGYPRLTPWVDDGRAPTTNLGRSAPANRWRFAGLAELETLYRAAWRLGPQAPPSLSALRDDMLRGVDAEPAAQANAVAAYEQRIDEVAAAVETCEASERLKGHALADLAGVFMQPESPRPGTTPDAAVFAVRVTKRLPTSVRCQLSVGTESGAAVEAGRWIELPTLRSHTLSTEVRELAGRGPVLCRVQVDGEWRGRRFKVEFPQVVGDVGLGEWQAVGPFDGRANEEEVAKRDKAIQRVETEPFDADQRYAGQNGECRWQRVARPANASVVDEFVLDFQELYGKRTHATAYALTWLDSDKERDVVLALGSDDGVIVRLNGREVHRNLVQRGYASQSDRVPLRLQAGRNVLLVQVTQGDGDWKFGARVVDAAGLPPNGVKITAGP